MQSNSKEFEILLEVDKSSRILNVTPDTLLVVNGRNVSNLCHRRCALLGRS